MKTTRRKEVFSSTFQAFAGGMLFASGLLLSGPASAQQGGGDRLELVRARLEARFKSADSDGDGLLTRAEAQAGMPFVSRNFDKIDNAGKGSVGLAEIESWMAGEALARRKDRGG